MTKCSKCGATTNLVKHHISYSPEVTDLLCDKCHRRLISRSIKGARLPIIRLFRTGIHFPKDLIERLGGDIVEIYTPPLSPIAILLPLGLDFKRVKESLQIVMKDVELRMRQEDER